MHIEKLVVENFRCFERREFEFKPGFNLLIGDNASGKTAILEAIAHALGSFVYRIGAAPKTSLSSGEPRVVRHVTAEGYPEIQRQFPVKIIVDGKLNDEHVICSMLYQSLDHCADRSSGLSEIARRLLDLVRRGEPVTLPLFRRFDDHRQWRPATEISTDKPGRLDTYADALGPNTNYAPLDQWFRWQEAVAAQRGSALPQFAAIQQALSSCVPMSHRLFYDLLNSELRIDKGDGSLLSMDMLSAGYRNTIAMISDIAFRCASLNPHLGSEVLRGSPGVVLIDEIDLHLHPKWQRRIVGDLQVAFPKLQFIATTHSPFIIQSLERGHLIDLSDPTGDWRNKSIEEIAEQIMGVENPQRSRRFLAMVEAAERYYKLLEQLRDADDERARALKAELDELLIPYADEPAYAAWLKMERLAAEGAREKR